jgi:hypothetical protein
MIGTGSISSRCQLDPDFYRKPKSTMTTISPTTPLRRFILAAVDSSTDDCLIWPGYKDCDGYGKIEVAGKTHIAHRLVLQLVTGETGEGLDAAHTPVICHTPACVNPRHLRWATHVENYADKHLDGTMPDHRGEAHPGAVLTEADVLAIYRNAGGEYQRVLAARYGVCRGAVSKIQTGRRWAHLTGATKR